MKLYLFAGIVAAGGLWLVAALRHPVPQGAAPVLSNPAGPVSAAVPPPLAPAVPESAWPSIRDQIAAEQRAFREAPDGALHSYNPTGGERLILHPDGSASLKLRGEERAAPEPAAPGTHLAAAAVVSPEEERPGVVLTWKAAALGRGDRPAPLTDHGTPRPVAKHHTERFLTSAEGDVVEWWKSEVRGFEAGWTVAARPAGEGPLRLELTLDCPWPAEPSGDGQRLVFTDPAGSGWRMVCDGLLAWDAAGRALPARMAAAQGSLTISVEDAGAAYPVVIDPWLYGDRALSVKANDATTGAKFGSVAAACGDVLAVEGTGSGNNGYAGQVYILSRSGSNYGVRRKILNVLSPPGSSTAPNSPLAVSGDIVAVGPLLGGTGLRMVLYERNTGGPSAFGQVAEVDGGVESPFNSPRLSGDVFAASLTRDDSAGVTMAGLVRIYRRDAGGPSAWGLTATLDAGDLRRANGVFGLSTELEGRTLVTGGLVAAGSLGCFIFEKTDDQATSWVRRKVLPLPGVPLAPLTLKLYGDLLLVGVPAAGAEGIRVFERNTGGPDNWGLVRTIPAPAGAADFGFSMALQGGLLAVGSPEEDVDHDGNSLTPRISEAGTVRLYAMDAGGVHGWGLVQSFSDGLNAEAQGRYGSGLAFADGRLFIGRPKGDAFVPNVVDSGTVDGVALGAGGWRGRPLSAHTQNATGWGSAVAVSGPYVLVGAPRFDGPSGVDAGWAFLFRDGELVKSLLPSAQQGGEQFGYSVAMDGDRLVVGSPLRSGFLNIQNYPDLGAVTIFERNEGGAENWGVVKSFSQPSINNSSASPEFGTSVALRGDVLVVGAPEETALSLPGVAVRGRTKIFYRNTGGADNWGQLKSFQGEDRGSDEFFGTSVSLSGDTLLVGAPGEEITSLIRAGAAYLYRRNEGGPDNWGRVVRLTQPVVKADSFFGFSVALDGDDALIGAPREDHPGKPNAGAAYFFAGGRTVQDDWVLTREWRPGDLVEESQGGDAVALSHGLALIGIPNMTPTTGRTELLSKHAGGVDQWGLVWSDGDQESFGTAVAMDGLHFAIGAPLAEVTENSITQTDRGEAADYVITAGEFAAVAVRQAGAGAARMGTSVALHREWLAVGAPDEDINADADAGAAYLFHRDRPAPGAWGLVQRLVDVQDNAANTRFGAALALDAQWLMVGVPGAHRVQTYYRQDQNTPQGLPWVDSVSLSAGGQPNALGTSLAMENGVLVAGAPLQDVSGNADSGAAYLFERNMAGADAWGLLTALTPTDPGSGDAFGTSVALSDSSAAVGSPLDNNAEGVDAGAVYLFERNEGGANAWGQSRKATHSSQTAGDEMGRSVALRDALLLTGLPRADAAGGTDSGRALLFSRNGGGAGNWGLSKSFSAPDGSPSARFGAAVAVDRDHAVIGAPFADPRGLANAGAAYVYSREWTGDEAWAPLQTLAPTDCTAGAEFGTAVALDGGTLAFGAPVDHGTGRAQVQVLRGRRFYDDWAVAHGLEGAWALPEADADGDGQANLIELVLGTHPRDGADLGRISLTLSGGNVILTAHKNQACTVPLGFTAETSANLASWTAATPAQILTDNASQLQIQLPAGGGRQFARWRATLP